MCLTSWFFVCLALLLRITVMRAPKGCVHRAVGAQRRGSLSLSQRNQRDLKEEVTFEADSRYY